MQLDIYVNYDGRCEEAFGFYAQHLGGTMSFSWPGTSDQPGRPNLPPDWGPKVLHARLDLGGTLLMGADIPGAQPMRSAYVALRSTASTRQNGSTACYRWRRDLHEDGGDILCEAVCDVPRSLRHVVDAAARIRSGSDGVNWRLAMTVIGGFHPACRVGPRRRLPGGARHGLGPAARDRHDRRVHGRAERSIATATSISPTSSPSGS